MWVWARGLGVRGWYVWGGFAGPGGDLLFHALRRSTIGAEGFHGRVRDGIGCFAPRYGHQAGQTVERLGRSRAPWSDGAPVPGLDPEIKPGGASGRLKRVGRSEERRVGK